ncbi:hypothetical protein DSO57_1035903 [Entomophthora muscae]|uniref:Uncharacterized protein n=1 Tax=Entomophthora muscae TaxID=34485 RepID=A0ACC2RE16_9FUNG|nr:hypothetical protein DSO57_1035903 [Entomophthora muscae]
MIIEEVAAWFMEILAFPYAEMEPWRRRAIMTTVYVIERFFEMLPYASFATLAYVGLRGQYDFGSVMLGWWCFSELLFYVYCHTKLGLISKYRYEIPLVSIEEKEALAMQMCEHMTDMEKDLGGWMVRPATKVYQSDVATWLVWAFTGKSRCELTSEEWVEVERILAIFNKRLLKGPEKEWRDESEFLRPTLDKINVSIRSLFVLGGYLGLRTFGITLLKYDGFEWWHIADGIDYWIREPKEEDGMPILFLHGGGGGIYMYPAHFAYLVRQFPNRRIIILVVSCATTTPAAPMMGAPEITRGIDQLLKENNISQVSVFAHSYGSVVAGWLLKHNPACIGRLTMVDPICFQMWNPTLLLKLIYAEPSCLFHHVLYLLSRDPAFGAFLHNFSVPQHVFFPESITPPTQIFIAERDWVVDGPESYKYLMQRKAKSNLSHVDLHLVNMTHGGYLLNLNHMARFSANL